LGPEFEGKVTEIVARYPQPRAALLPVLWEVQQRQGWVDAAAEAWVAERLGISPAQVHGAVTFYTLFRMRPMGRYHFQVCTTLPCMLRGADELLAHIEGRLGIEAGQVSHDGKYSLIRVECLGSCGTAPMLQLNDDYHEDLDPAKVDRLIEGLR
jgi:NADH-quinone oxidoreductase subunit E